jgi:hypothetical protein
MENGKMEKKEIEVEEIEYRICGRMQPFGYVAPMRRGLIARHVSRYLRIHVEKR